MKRRRRERKEGRDQKGCWDGRNRRKGKGESGIYGVFHCFIIPL